MKSRRMRATASSWVTSRAISSRSATPNGHDLDGEGHPGIALRFDDDRVGVIARLDVAHELRLAHEVDERGALILREIETQQRPARGGSPT